MENFENVENIIIKVCKGFGLRGEYRKFETINSGHINNTYRVYYFRDGELKDYIVQRVNTYVFTRPVEVMENIAGVTEYIRSKIKAQGRSSKRYVLHYQKTAEGKYYVDLGEEGFWRCCRFINNSVSFLKPENNQIIERSGKAFGEFQRYLSDYPVEKLHIVIPHFHNTVMRYGAFREAIANDEAGRKDSVLKEIEGYFSFEEIATRAYQMQKEGELPLRVTHNDTKSSNVLFDSTTGEHLSVIDLDTVMPGLVAFDFGDAIRIVASTGEEDERDLDKVAVDLEKYESFAKGFVEEVGGMLTASEVKTLALGAITMTVECGMRFLTDYLNGDKYFKIHYPDQNLVRAKCHLVLAADMLKNQAVMQQIVEKYVK